MHRRKSRLALFIFCLARYAVPMWMSKLTVSFSLVAAAALSQSIYTWTDAQGVEHFTDDAARIPKKAVAKALLNNSVSVVGPKTPMESQAKPSRLGLAAASSNVDEQSRSESFWRRSFREARRKVLDLEAEIVGDERKIAEGPLLRMVCQPSFSPVFGLPIPGPFVNLQIAAPGVQVTSTVGPVWQNQPYPNCVPIGDADYIRAKDRLDRNRRELTYAQSDLSDLERRAALNAVPLEWRR
jgi:hypothetical protein